MLKKLKVALKQIASQYAPVPFDASRFNDPLAMQIQWTPVKPGGTNFRTHKLAMIDFNRMEFKTSIGARLFYSVFLLVGLGVGIGFTIAAAKTGTPFFESDFIIPILFGLVFTIAGGVLFYIGAKPVVFDKRSGYFWKCWKAPDKAFNPNAMEDYTKLSDIHALQLISEFIRGDKSSYHSYELNLVLKDGNRVNVVDHGNQVKLQEDARTLADFLGKPVWDAI